MWLIDKLADARIAEAQRAGEFKDLPGQGNRVELEADGLIPEELRVTYRLLKNAGYAPPEVGLLRDISEIEQLIAGMDTGQEKSSALKKLNLLRAQLGTRAANLDLTRDYCSKIVSRLDRSGTD